MMMPDGEGLERNGNNSPPELNQEARLPEKMPDGARTIVSRGASVDEPAPA